MQQRGISMTIPVWKPARAEMLKRSAHFKNLKEVNTGVPDMEIDGYRDRKTARIVKKSKPSQNRGYPAAG